MIKGPTDALFPDILRSPRMIVRMKSKGIAAYQ